MAWETSKRPESDVGDGILLHPLSARRLLEAWEQGQGRSAAELAGILLGCATPEQSRKVLAALPLGQRDRLLLHLRAATLGPTLHGRVSCPGCANNVLFSVDISDIEAGGAASPAAAMGRLAKEGYELQFRVLSADDLEVASRCASVGEAQTQLLHSCVLEARFQGQAIDAAELPDAVLQALCEELESRDPLAESALAVACNACGHEWHALLDIGAFFFSEVEDCADRLLRDVRDLARSFHWSEAEILAMSSLRRQRYLELMV